MDRELKVLWERAATDPGAAPEVFAALARWHRAHPARREASKPLLARLLRWHPGLADTIPGLPPADQPAALLALQRLGPQREAAPGEIPAWLLDPPWRRPRLPLPELPDLRPPPPPPDALLSEDVLPINHQGGPLPAWRVDDPGDRAEIAACLTAMSRGSLSDLWALRDAILAGEIPWERMAAIAWQPGAPDQVARLPGEVLAWMLEGRLDRKDPRLSCLLLHRPGLDAARWLIGGPGERGAWPALLRVRSAALVAPVAGLLERDDPWAYRWLALHAEVAAPILLGIALSPGGAAADRRAARRGLEAVIAGGGREVIRAALGRVCADPGPALPWLDADPLLHVPEPGRARLPPSCLRPWLPRLRLRGGGLLPAEAQREALSCLALSGASGAWVGAARIAEALDLRSLAALLAALMEGWAEEPPGDTQGWTFAALRLLDAEAAAGIAEALEELARGWSAAHHLRVGRLSAILQEWAEGGGARGAVGAGLILRINGRHPDRPSVRAAVALGGGDPDACLDRAIPAVGEGEIGYGAGGRRFRICVGEAGPVILDAGGRRLRGLPPAAQGEDPAAALEAQERLAAVGRRIKAIREQERGRLELALRRQRRWDPAGWRALLAHPVALRLAQALFWEIEGAGGSGRAIRVAEDGAAVDLWEEPFDPAGDTAIRLLHPARHDPGVLRRLAEIAADYQLLAPFPQLGREVYRPAPEEAAARSVAIRRAVHRDRLIGLTTAWDGARWSEPWPRDARLRLVYNADPRVVLHFAPALTDAFYGEHTLERVAWGEGADPALISEAVVEARAA